VQELSCTLDVAASELLDGRLPSACFRAFAKAPQLHVGIGTRDVLTIDPGPRPCVGDLVIQTNNQGDSRFGVLRQDGPDDSKPGSFWLGSTDHDSDVRFETEDWCHIATVLRVDRADHVALASGRTDIDRRSRSGGREELL
jgi:hypothetical protein